MKTSIEPGPACGCCGVQGVALHRVGGPAQHRCGKHLGRLPCCIEGCGKTFAMNVDDTYDHITMCGAHWRLGSKRERVLLSKVRRKIKRIGETDQLLRLAHRLWWKVHAEVTAGHQLDESEINKMFGWDE